MQRTEVFHLSFFRTPAEDGTLFLARVSTVGHFFRIIHIVPALLFAPDMSVVPMLMFAAANQSTSLLMQRSYSRFIGVEHPCPSSGPSASGPAFPSVPFHGFG
ncbi:phosphatidylinositol 3,4,5-trisphosphate 5-phosphatase 2A-like protein [Anopheles sinensis]|uniref:Phosphatidylinositol 3,4,5-trisphosphate 5-phosphatase 2A-like protein n=1 Tax=Anopheles sinensis TaxID=74873 RepID=A0A084WAF6_ANOSI|nr:phosphatidylinositol 3,4,5-trisphosphate 5-phosphatase 2A-like protein [Anopheles sinensis]